MIDGSVDAPDQVRFGFGNNWLEFISALDDRRIAEAELSLRTLFGCQHLNGMTFLDIGSGSGLFSLVARRLGARVHSFDYDADSVTCTRTLRERYFPNDDSWTVEQGSILDASYVAELGTFDVVYSWGVLHHTGAMYQAIENAASRVRPGGIFAFALYRKTRLCFAWTVEKRWYAGASERGQRFARWLYSLLMRVDCFFAKKNFDSHVANYYSVRGMDYFRDIHDWLGGYPYESIRSSEVADIMKRFEFDLVFSNATDICPFGIFGSGCDEFVYRRKGVESLSNQG